MVDNKENENEENLEDNLELDEPTEDQTLDDFPEID